METKASLRTVVALITIIAVAGAFAGPVAAQPDCSNSVNEENPSGSFYCSDSTPAGDGEGGLAVDGSNDELSTTGSFYGQNSIGQIATWSSTNVSADGGDATVGEWDTNTGGQEVSCEGDQSGSSCS